MNKHTLCVDLWYPGVDIGEPRTDELPTEVKVGLVSVHAADDILIRYDYGRNAYVIYQQPIDAEGEVGKWQEVAFVEAWALDRSMPSTVLYLGSDAEIDLLKLEERCR